MLKNSASRNQRFKGVKAKLAFRTLLVLAVAAWMMYQLRVFLSHKVASEDGGVVKEVIGSQRLKLGRKGLVLLVPDGDKSEYDDKETGRSEDKGGTEKEAEDEDEIEQGEDDEDEGLDMEPLDDPLEENDTDENANRIERETGDDNSSTKLEKDATTERM